MSAIAGLNLIGRSVVAPTEQLALEAGGAAVASYRLAGEASNVSMSIVSADGTLLRSFDGLSGSAGELHNVTWDGMDYEGLPLPEGSYYMVVSAADAAGNSVPAQTYAASRVTGMTYENGLATLQMANGGTTLAGLIEEIR
nr:FlgD immunoglobulin-like domain containing protein [Salipiger bermudensis]